MYFLQFPIYLISKLESRRYVLVKNVNIALDIGLSLIQHQAIIWIKIIFVN